MLIPTVKLNNGKSIPILGLGTWNSTCGVIGEALSKEKSIPVVEHNMYSNGLSTREVTQAVKHAIDAGYRHIDCAYVYENEEEVGEAVRAKIAEGVVKREDLFITSKLWNTFHDPKEVRGAIETSLKNLGLDFIDLYLIHWPMGYVKSENFFPKKTNGEPAHTNFDLLDTYRAMEELVDAKLTKSIGVSNFNIKQITYITENARIQPVVNQFECHPYLLNKALREHCKSKNILVTAYSPLGSPGRPNAMSEERVILKDPKVLEIAKKHNKTPAQILIRFQIQLGNAVIPKSVTKERIISNSDVFNFELSDVDMNELQNFGFVQRACAITADKIHPEYPFHEG